MTPQQLASVSEVRSQLATDPHWRKHAAFDGASHLHLAIFIEPYLSLLFEGTKTIESRFSQRRSSPWGQVLVGDALLLKRSSGPIVGIAEVAQVWSLELDKAAWHSIERDFSRDICLLDGDAEALRQTSRYATLVRVSHIRRLNPVPFAKRDRRGWVVLR